MHTPRSRVAVSGIVLDADSRQPVALAKVSIPRTGVAGIQTPPVTYTDSLGMFQFAEVAAFGQYNVECERDGYVFSIRPVQRYSATLDLSPKTGDAHVILYLRREVVIKGTISDPSGPAKIAGSVKAFRFEAEDGWPMPVEVMGSYTELPGDGQTRRFRLSGLTPGRYIVAFLPNRFWGMDYPLVIYPNSPNTAGAQILEMPPGTERVLDFRIPRIETYRVSGKALTTDKRWFSWIERLDDKGLPIRESFGGSQSMVDFTFHHTNVPPDDYVLNARWTDAGTMVHVAKRITVPGPAMGGIILEAPSQSPETSAKFLTGVIKTDSPEAEQFGRRLLVKLIAGRIVASRMAEPNGSFVFDYVPPGSYQVKVDTYGSEFVKSLQQGGRKLSSEGVIVGNGAPEPLEIRIGAGTSAVRGTVHLPGVNLDAGLAVGFLRDAGGFWVLQKTVMAVLPLRFRSPNHILVQNVYRLGLPCQQQTQEIGHFCVEGLPSGEYLAFAWLADTGSDKELPYNTPEFLARFGWAAERIKIDESGVNAMTVHDVLPWEAFGIN